MVDDLEQLFTLKTIEATGETNSITLDISKSIGDIATALDLLTNWSATVESGYAAYPSLSLTSISYQSLEENDQMTLVASTWPVNMSRVDQVEGLYRTSSDISQGKPYVIIYNGGYASVSIPDDTDIPDDLIDAATQISANTFNLAQQDQNLQSEKIGDYSWTKAVGGFLTEVLPAWYTVLATYKKPSMG